MTEVRKHRRTTASGKTTTVRQHHRKGDSAQDGRPERFLLTVRSRSGKRINIITGAPEDTIMVHGREDLERRLRAAEQDPDLVASYRDERAPAPHVSSLTASERPDPDFSWLDGDEKPDGDFWAEDDGSWTCNMCHGQNKPGETLCWHCESDGNPANRGAEPEPPRWRNLSREERKAAVAAYHDADDALQANGEQEKAAGIDYETDRFHELNDSFWDAAKKVPWYRRWRAW